MARRLAPEELRLWSHVSATVRPGPGRVAPKGAAPLDPNAPAARIPPPPKSAPVSAARRAGVDPIEPNRKRKISREIAPLEAVLDLHGHDQMSAEQVLKSFILGAWSRGHRSILVITGRGVQGGGVLRKRTPEWLAAPELAKVVAGFSAAHQKHGGDGALYVALKRKPHSSP